MLANATTPAQGISSAISDGLRKPLAYCNALHRLYWRRMTVEVRGVRKRVRPALDFVRFLIEWNNVTWDRTRFGAPVVGLSYGSIAEKLGVSYSTAKRHAEIARAAGLIEYEYRPPDEESPPGHPHAPHEFVIRFDRILDTPVGSEHSKSAHAPETATTPIPTDGGVGQVAQGGRSSCATHTSNSEKHNSRTPSSPTAADEKRVEILGGLTGMERMARMAEIVALVKATPKATLAEVVSEIRSKGWKEFDVRRENDVTLAADPRAMKKLAYEIAVRWMSERRPNGSGDHTCYTVYPSLLTAFVKFDSGEVAPPPAPKPIPSVVAVEPAPVAARIPDALDAVVGSEVRESDPWLSQVSASWSSGQLVINASNAFAANALKKQWLSRLESAVGIGKVVVGVMENGLRDSLHRFTGRNWLATG